MNPPTPPTAQAAQEQRHSPLPWSVMGHNDNPPMIISGTDGGCVAKTFEFVSRKERGEAMDNAAHIVHCVNSHAALSAEVKALKEWKDAAILRYDKAYAEVTRLREVVREAGSLVSEYATEQRGFADQIISPRSAKQARLDVAQRAETVLVKMHAALKGVA